MNKHDGRLSSVVFTVTWNNLKKTTLQPECHEFIRRYLQFRGQNTRDAPGVGLHCGSQKVTFYRICVDYVVQWKEVWTICFKVRPMFLENINTYSLQRKCTRALDFRWCWCLVQLTWRSIIFHRKLASLFFHWQYSTSTMETSRTSTNFKTIAENVSGYSLWVNDSGRMGEGLRTQAKKKL